MPSDAAVPAADREQKDEDAALWDCEQLYSGTCGRAALLARQPSAEEYESGRPAAMFQHLYDARAELDGLRRRLIARLMQSDRTHGRLRRWLKRHILRLYVLLHDNHAAASEAAEGYQLLDTAQRCLVRQRKGEEPQAADFDVPPKQAAAPPSFDVDPGADGRVGFANFDILLQCITSMGVAWSRWGDQQHAATCFDAAETVYRQWQLHRGRQCSPPGSSGTISAMIAESERQSSELQRSVLRERDEQLQRLAAKLEAKRRRRGLRAVADGDADVSASTAPAAGPSACAAAPTSRPPPCADADPFDHEAAPASAAERREVQEAVEQQYTVVCHCLAQLHRFSGDSELSAHYCHLTLQRQLEGSLRGKLAWRDWVTNCADLCDYYLAVGDLSNAEHCLAAARLLVGDRGGAGLERADATEADAELEHVVDFMAARWYRHALKRLERHRAELRRGCILPLLGDRPGAGSEEASPAEQKRFRLPIPPPRSSATVTPELAASWAQQASSLYRAAMVHFNVDVDCERYCLAHLDLNDVLSVQQLLSGAGGEERLRALGERTELLRSILAVGFDELVFRNVLRQVHFGLACIHQEAAELLISSGAAPERFTPELDAGAEHFRKFSARFLHEFSELQKVRKPHERSALLRLEGSDAPAFVVGEMRHAQLLCLYPDAEVGPVLAKFKSVIRFVDTNAEASAEYPELLSHAEQCRQMVQLLKRGVKPANVAAARLRSRHTADLHADPAAGIDAPDSLRMC